MFQNIRFGLVQWFSAWCIWCALACLTMRLYISKVIFWKEQNYCKSREQYFWTAHSTVLSGEIIMVGLLNLKWLCGKNNKCGLVRHFMHFLHVSHYIMTEINFSMQAAAKTLPLNLSQTTLPFQLSTSYTQTCVHKQRNIKIFNNMPAPAYACLF